MADPKCSLCFKAIKGDFVNTIIEVTNYSHDGCKMQVTRTGYLTHISCANTLNEKFKDAAAEVQELLR